MLTFKRSREVEMQSLHEDPSGSVDSNFNDNNFVRYLLLEIDALQARDNAIKAANDSKGEAIYILCEVMSELGEAESDLKETKEELEAFSVTLESTEPLG